MAEIRDHATLTRRHMRVDIKGALRNWDPRLWRDCVTEGDRTLSVSEVKDQLLEKLSRGELYLPMGDCDDFDPTTGCKGHPMEPEGAAS